MPGYTLPDGMTVKNKLGAISHAELEKEALAADALQRHADRKKRRGYASSNFPVSKL